MSRYENTPRVKLREIIEKCQRGPSFTIAGRDGMTKAHQAVFDESVRMWLDSWIVPGLLDVEEALFKPTRQQLDRFELSLSDADHKRIGERTEELVARHRRPDAKRLALVEAYNVRRRAKGKR